MSRATDSAESVSAPTEEPSVEDDEPSVDSQGTARALTVRTQGSRDPLRGTDRAMARRLAEKAEEHKHTEITAVEIERYSHLVHINLRGRIVLSYRDVGGVADNTYAVKNLIAHSTGSVEVTFSTL